MNLARNIVEDVRFIVTTMVCSVLVVVWHYVTSAGLFIIACLTIWSDSLGLARRTT